MGVALTGRGRKLGGYFRRVSGWFGDDLGMGIDNLKTISKFKNCFKA